MAGAEAEKVGQAVALPSALLALAALVMVAEGLGLLLVCGEAVCAAAVAVPALLLLPCAAAPPPALLPLAVALSRLVPLPGALLPEALSEMAQDGEEEAVATAAGPPEALGEAVEAR